MNYRIELTGKTPLIMHHDDVLHSDWLEARRTEIKEKTPELFKAGDDRCPPDTWKGYLWQDGTRVVIPTDTLFSCLRKVGGGIVLKKQKSIKSLTQTGMRFADPNWPLLVSGKEIHMAAIKKIKGDVWEQRDQCRELGFDLLVKRAAVGQSKHVRVRPIFADWSCSGTVIITDPRFTRALVEKAWEAAGTEGGYGDWRPSAPKSPGPFGIANVKVTQVSDAA